MPFRVLNQKQYDRTVFDNQLTFNFVSELVPPGDAKIQTMQTKQDLGTS